MNTLPTEEKIATSSTTSAERATPEKKKNPFLETLQFIVIALIIVLPIRFFIAQPFIVSGASMENTFHNNEYLIVDRLTYHFNEPQRGDVIIFKYPKDPSKYFIKRIIAVPGDTIDISDQSVRISNRENPEDIMLSEPYIKSMDKEFIVQRTLQEDEYFVMGDNRDASSDSRIWGTLPGENIIGRAFIRLFPFSDASVLPGKATIDSDNSIRQ